VKRAFLLGSGLSHSISTAVHNAGAESLGLDWCYELLDVDRSQLEASLERLRRADCVGANVTMPFKADAALMCDRRSISVELSGAANLLLNHGGELVAGNTDVEGMVELLDRRRGQVEAGLAVVIGTGGAASATVEALASVPPESLLVLGRRREAATELALRAGERLSLPTSAGVLDEVAELPAETALVVNASAIGMGDEDRSPVSATAIGPEMLVYDFVYRRAGTTPLQREALAAGAQVCDGAAHLLAQALPTFAALTGVEPPEAVLRDAVAAAVGRPPLEWHAERASA
jgi:shikimate dehydrogenase